MKNSIIKRKYNLDGQNPCVNCCYSRELYIPCSFEFGRMKYRRVGHHYCTFHCEVVTPWWTCPRFDDLPF